MQQGALVAAETDSMGDGRRRYPCGRVFDYSDIAFYVVRLSERYRDVVRSAWAHYVALFRTDVTGAFRSSG